MITGTPSWCGKQVWAIVCAAKTDAAAWTGGAGAGQAAGAQAGAGARLAGGQHRKQIGLGVVRHLQGGALDGHALRAGRGGAGVSGAERGGAGRSGTGHTWVTSSSTFPGGAGAPSGARPHMTAAPGCLGPGWPCQPGAPGGARARPVVPWLAAVRSGCHCARRLRAVARKESGKAQERWESSRADTVGVRCKTAQPRLSMRVRQVAMQ